MSIINLLEIIMGIAFLIMIFTYFYLPSRKLPPEWVNQVRGGQVSKNVWKVYRKYPDKQRFFYFWLQLLRIEKSNIIGDLAELGVYKGHTAKIMHTILPQRKLHLFDTFSGFDASDLQNETGKASGYDITSFSDCSEEGVKEYIKGNNNLVFHPGNFCNIVHALPDYRFAFVSIDADLFNPTIAGLEYFYNKLSPGGAIIIHDYNYQWPGVVKAVNCFCRKIPEIPVELSDMDSSILLVKNKIINSQD